MNEIKIPSKLDYKSILHVIGKLNSLKFNESIILDFSKVTFVTPGGATPLLAYLLENQNRFKEIKNIIEDKSNIDNYLTRMGFYELLDIQSIYPGSKLKGEGRFQELYNFNYLTDDEEVGLRRENVMSLFTRNSTNKRLINAINWCVTELVDNAHTHSLANTCVLFAQKYKSFKEFCIADCGIGIRESTEEIDISTALKNCIREHYKGKKSTGRGNGLYYTSELIKTDSPLNKCKLIIHSEDSRLIISSGKLYKIYDDRPFWKGTIVTLIIDDNIQKDISELIGYIPYGLEDLEKYDDIF